MGPAPDWPAPAAMKAAWRCCAGIDDEYSSRYSGSTPGRAFGGGSTVELRTAPEPDRMAELGLTDESIDEPGIVGTVGDGTVVAPSVVTVALDPQVLQGVVAARPKIGRYVVVLLCEQPDRWASAINPAAARHQRRGAIRARTGFQSSSRVLLARCSTRPTPAAGTRRQPNRKPDAGRVVNGYQVLVT